MSGTPKVAIEITGSASGAQKALQSTERDLSGFRNKVRSQFTSLGNELKDILNSKLTQALSLGALAAGLRYAFQQADELANSNRKLAATATLAGQNLGFLQQTARDAQEAFGLSAHDADEFTISLTKLTSRAGQTEKTGAAISALLDLAAAKGLDANQALEAINQTLAGQDEGTDKLFQKNPSQIYAEWAKHAGVAAGKMDSVQQAQAILDAVINDGTKVRGQYSKWLESAAGQQYLLQVQTETAAASIGRSMEGVRLAVIPVLAQIASGVVKFVGGIQLLGASLPVYLGQVKLYLAELDESWGGTIQKIADRMTRFGDWLEKQPTWLRVWFGIGNFVAPTGNFLADAVAGGVDGAKAELARLRAAYEAEAKKIVADMNNMTAIVGSTAPINPKLPKPPASGAGGAGNGVIPAPSVPNVTPTATQGSLTAGGLVGTGGVVLPTPPPTSLERYGQALKNALGSTHELSQLLSDLTLNTISAFGDAVSDAFEAWASGSGSAADAFRTAMLGAIAAVAKGLGNLYATKAVAAFGDGLLGDPRGWAAGAKYLAAAAGFFALAGTIGGLAARGGGGGAGGASAPDLNERQDAASNSKGEAVIVLEGSSWQTILSDPVAADSFAAMLEDISDRRVVVTTR